MNEIHRTLLEFKDGMLDLQEAEHRIITNMNKTVRAAYELAIKQMRAQA